MQRIRNLKLLIVITSAMTITAGIFIYYHGTTFTSVGFEDFPKECPLHHVATKTETVKNFGFVNASYGPGVFEAKAKKFPLDTINTGYGHPNTRYKRIRRKFCPECRKAREKWFAEIRRDRDPSSGK